MIISSIVLVLLFSFDRVIKLGFLNASEVFQGVFSFLPFSTEVFYNPGIIFGIALPTTVTIIMSTVLVLVVVWYCLQAVLRKDKWGFFGWGLIIIGGGSNMIDRIQFGAVIDWLVMPWQAVINLADVYITVGILILVLHLFFSKNKPQSV